MRHVAILNILSQKQVLRFGLCLSPVLAWPGRSIFSFACQGLLGRADHHHCFQTVSHDVEEDCEVDVSLWEGLDVGG